MAAIEEADATDMKYPKLERSDLHRCICIYQKDNDGLKPVLLADVLDLVEKVTTIKEWMLCHCTHVGCSSVKDDKQFHWHLLVILTSNVNLTRFLKSIHNILGDTNGVYSQKPGYSRKIRTQKQCVHEWSHLMGMPAYIFKGFYGETNNCKTNLTIKAGSIFEKMYQKFLDYYPNRSQITDLHKLIHRDCFGSGENFTETVEPTEEIITGLQNRETAISKPSSTPTDLCLRGRYSTPSTPSTPTSLK